MPRSEVDRYCLRWERVISEKPTSLSKVDASLAAVKAYFLFSSWVRRSVRRFGTLWEGSSLAASAFGDLGWSSTSSSCSSAEIGVDQPNSCSFKSTEEKSDSVERSQSTRNTDDLADWLDWKFDTEHHIASRPETRHSNQVAKHDKQPSEHGKKHPVRPIQKTRKSVASISNGVSDLFSDKERFHAKHCGVIDLITYGTTEASDIGIE